MSQLNQRLNRSKIATKAHMPIYLKEKCVKTVLSKWMKHMNYMVKDWEILKNIPHT